MTPEFVVAGHVVEDLLPDGGWRPGGAACYAALMARNLGFDTAVLTSSAGDFPLPELLAGITVKRVPSRQTTQMRNVYEGGRRTQWLSQQADRLTANDLPPEWSGAHIALLGPVAGEVDPALAAVFSKDTIIGAGAQGWLRKADDSSLVLPLSPRELDAAALLEHVDLVFLSEEDLPGEGALESLREWERRVDILAFTRGEGGADIFASGERRSISAFPARAVDPTGAGDIFAAAFLARYSRERDPWEAARFAAAASSLVIEGEGLSGVPHLDAIEARMVANPAVVAD
jgi:sugar/nucleoside kinase (ribokinase family)